MTDRSRARPWVYISYAGVFLLGFYLELRENHGLSNDHGGYLSTATQVVLLGELPIRDFFDFGAFLHTLLSAGVQYLFGHRLLGEMILCWSLIALGFCVTYNLASRACRSHLGGFLITLPAILLCPRPYGYPKVLLYPLGIFLIWRYLEQPSRRNLLLVAICSSGALLFRLDHGIVLSSAATVAIALLHVRRPFRHAVADLFAFWALFLLCLSPYLLFVAGTVGIEHHIRTILQFGQYANDRRDSISWQPLMLSPSLLTPQNGLALLYDGLLILSALAPLRAIREATRDLRAGGPLSTRTVQFLTVAVVWFAALPVLVRDNFYARVPDIAPLAAVLLAWVLHFPVRQKRADSAGTDRRKLSALRQVASVLASLLVILGAITAALLQGPANVGVPAKAFSVLLDRPVSLTLGILSGLSISPPWAGIAVSGDNGLARYFADCTDPTDRIFLAFYGAHLFYLSGRGFAGNQWLYRGFNNSADQQAALVAKLRSQSIPLVVTKADEIERFRRDYPEVARYFEENYRSDSALPPDMTLLVDAKREIVRRLDFRDLPCFR